VRKKLRRKQRLDAPSEAAPSAPPPVPQASVTGVYEVATESLPSMHGDISTSEIGSAGGNVHLEAAIASARHLRSALGPANLRQLFILTELLQPPKALRRED
jgi:hypothetical protein